MYQLMNMPTMQLSEQTVNKPRTNREQTVNKLMRTNRGRPVMTKGRPVMTKGRPVMTGESRNKRVTLALQKYLSKRN